MDVARVVAMVLVVLDHAVIYVSPLYATDTGDPRWWVAEPLLAVSRLAVPIFLMVSGALLLDPARREPLRSFATRRLHRVGLPLLVWGVAYLVYRDIVPVLERDLTPDKGVRALLAGEPYYHLYYLYIALGMYALTPLLRRLIATVDRKYVAALCCFAFLFGVVDQFPRFDLHLGATNGFTMFIDYIGFYLAGWLLRDAASPRRATAAAAVLVAAMAAVVLGTWALINADEAEHWFYLASYLSPTVIVASLALFVLLQSARLDVRGRTVFRRLADLSLGTYLVHPMVLDLIRPDLDDRGPTMPPGVDGLLIWVWGLTLAGLVAGLTISFLARLVPGLRQVF